MPPGTQLNRLNEKKVKDLLGLFDFWGIQKIRYIRGKMRPITNNG